MRTNEQEAAHWYAVRYLMQVSAWSGVPKARRAGDFWPEAPAGVTQECWDALVDAEVAPFVGRRVLVQGDRLVPESAASAGGAQ